MAQMHETGTTALDDDAELADPEALARPESASADAKVALASPELDAVDVVETTAEDVTAYLEQHPQFFDAHPQLLEAIQLAHTSGTAASLIERQVNVLRKRNDQLRLRLHQLAQTARGNEQRVRHVNRFAVELLGAGDLDDVIARTRASLTRLFTVDAVTVGLYAPSPLAHAAPDGATLIGPEDPFRELYRDFIRTGLIECGPIAAEQSSRLFGDVPTASAAVVPLDRVSPIGVLAVGSADPQRFAPNMGTLFLDMAADLICAALRGVSREPAPG